ncbi:MAG: hypothetical protein HY235_05980 [Acidobacteria bacterium]|nr:hypothetical protein [Acidobacteriota bacterium]
MKIVLLVAACCAHAFAQPRLFPIAQLTVEGNRTYKADRILAVAGLKTGQMADQRQFEAARDRLVECGFFESVGYKYAPSAGKTGYDASFQVVEVQQVYPVRFDRMPMPSKELAAVLEKADPLFSEKIPGTRPVLARYAKVLEAHVKEAVVGKVTAEAPGELVILFQPAKMPPSIAEVRFVKNTILAATPLQNAVAGTAVGTLWDERRFRQILDASIRPLYEARGRIRVAFPSVTTEPVQDVNGVRVTVEVAEGETYTLGDVTVETQAGSPGELLRAADLKKGDIANFDEINAGIERMRNAVRRNGFLQAKAAAERKINDASKEVSLGITIDPGARFVFSKLNIAGLDILTEPVIRKMWTMKEGQPFNPEYPEHFLNRVREEGVFDNLGKTKSEVKIDEKDGTADVTLYFR